MNDVETETVAHAQILIMEMIQEFRDFTDQSNAAAEKTSEEILELLIDALDEVTPETA